MVNKRVLKTRMKRTLLQLGFFIGALGAVLLPYQNSQAAAIINEVGIGGIDFFEIFNYGLTPLNLNGYTANIRDSGFGSFDFALPSTVLNANSGLIVVADSQLPNVIYSGQNIPWNWDRNLSLTLRDSSNTVIDFWAHGSAMFGSPSGVTFSPNPLLAITSTSSAVSYQRVAVSSSGTNFFASDWVVEQASLGSENALQVRATAVPTPALLPGLIGLGMGVLRKRKGEAVEAEAEA